jgi:hypothetical protein
VGGEDPFAKLPKPGPEHKLLASLAGNYEASVKAYFDPSKGPEESKGVMKRSMILDDRYLKEEFQGKAAGKSFSGIAIVGYDVMKKKFVTNWIDSMSTGFMLSEGTYDKDTKTFTHIGEDIDPSTGKKMKSRDVLKIVNENEQHFEMYRGVDGKEFKVLEITYTRKK